MSFLASMFSGRQKGANGNSDEKKNAEAAQEKQKNFPELFKGMTLELYLQNEPLLTGRMTALTGGVMTLERLPGALSFRVCEPGATVSIRGCSRQMTQFNMQGVVTEASRTLYRLTELQAASYDEHRENFRLSLNTPITMYYQSDEHFQHPEECTLIDISIGGACVQSEFLHAEGEVLRLKIKMDEYATMEFLGEIIRVSEGRSGTFQYGILFAQLTNDEMEVLTRTLYNIQAGNKAEWSRTEEGYWASR